MYNDVVREVYSVARAKGIAVPEEHLETVINWPDRLEPSATTSLQRDIDEGRPSELEEQIGVVVRTGREVGLRTPIHSFIHNCLLPSERQARRKISSAG